MSVLKYRKKTSYARGLLAEKMAAIQLCLRGYSILQQRYKTRHGEIDMIARKGRILVFVEVKARQSARDALEAVDYRSRRRIEKAALWFVAQHPDLSNYTMRFDVMVFKGGGIWAQHLDNVWELGA